MKKIPLIVCSIFLCNSLLAQTINSTFSFSWTVPEDIEDTFFSIGISHPNMSSLAAKNQAKQIAEMWMFVGISTSVEGLQKKFSEEVYEATDTTYSENWSYATKLISPLYTFSTFVHRSIQFPDSSILVLMSGYRNAYTKKTEERGILIKYFSEEFTSNDSTHFEQLLTVASKKDKLFIQALQKNDSLTFEPERVDSNVETEKISEQIPSWFLNHQNEGPGFMEVVASQPYFQSSKKGFQLSDALCIAYAQAYLALSQKKDEDIRFMKQVLKENEQKQMEENPNLVSVYKNDANAFSSALKTISQNTLINTEISKIEITQSHVYIAVRSRYQSIFDWFKQ